MKNTKWCFKNSRKLGKIEGKIYALKLMIKGFCSDDNPLLVQIEEIEELVKEIELYSFGSKSGLGSQKSSAVSTDF